MITSQEFRDAMVIVESYIEQLHKANAGRSFKRVNEIGCKVKLNEFGIQMQGKHKTKLVGIVIDWFNWHTTPTFIDGIVTVKWEGTNRPDTMHASQLTPLHQKGIGRT